VYICQFKVHYRFLFCFETHTHKRRTRYFKLDIIYRIELWKDTGVMLTPSREMPFVLRDINKKECRSSTTTTTHAPYSSYTSSWIHQKSSGGKSKIGFLVLYRTTGTLRYQETSGEIAHEYCVCIDDGNSYVRVT
jgi:hypothetical protein